MSIMGGLWSRSDVTCKLLKIKRSRAGKFLLDKSSSLRNMLLFFLTCRWQHHDINIFKNISLLSKDWPPFFVRVFWVTKPHLRSHSIKCFFIRIIIEPIFVSIVIKSPVYISFDYSWPLFNSPWMSPAWNSWWFVRASGYRELVRHARNHYLLRSHSLGCNVMETLLNILRTTEAQRRWFCL